MIQLIKSSGRPVAIHPTAIATVTESSPSCKQHNIHCYIKTFDGMTHEVREGYQEVLALISQYASK